MNCDKLTGLDVLINDIFVEWSLPKNHDCWKTLVFIYFLFSLVLAVTVSFNIFYLTAIYVISSFHDMKHYLSYIDKVKDNMLKNYIIYMSEKTEELNSIEKIKELSKKYGFNGTDEPIE